MNRTNIAAALVGALSFPLIAQQQPCPPQSKAQKAAAWLNRARNPAAPAPANTGCQATSTPAAQSSPDMAAGTIIATGTGSQDFLAGGPGSRQQGSITFNSGAKGQIRWLWNGDKNQQSPYIFSDFGGPIAGQNGQHLEIEGRKGNVYYLRPFTYPGINQAINVSLEKNGTSYTLRAAGAQFPTDMTDLNGNPLEAPEPPAPKPSYVFQPYTKELEEGLYKAEQTQAGAGLKPGYHGGTLTITGPNGPVRIQLERPPKSAANFWVEAQDPDKGFIIDGAIVNPVLRRPDGTWVKEDGTPVRAFGALAEPK